MMYGQKYIKLLVQVSDSNKV